MGEIMEKRNWDLGHLYQANDDFEKDIKIVEKYLENIKKFNGKLNKEDEILDYFKLDTEMSIILDRLAVYAFCKKDDNGKDSQNVKNYEIINNLYSRIGESLAFAKVQIMVVLEEILLHLQVKKQRHLLMELLQLNNKKG